MARKEVRVSLKTGFIEESRIKSNHIYSELSSFYVDFFDCLCDNQKIVGGANNFDINKVVDKVINHALTKGLDSMLNNLKTFGLEIQSDGYSLKSLKGDTPAERREDFQLYKEYITLLNSEIFKAQAASATAANTPTATNIPTIIEKNELKLASFSELIASYADDKRFNGWEKDETYNGFYQKLMIILDLVGDLDCSIMTQQTGTQFLSDLVKLPSNPNKGKLATLSISEKLNLPDSYKRLSKASIYKYLSLFKALTHFGSDQDPSGVGGLNYLKYDIAKKLRYSFDKAKDTNSYFSFSDQELQKIVNGYVYNDSKTACRKSDDFVFWIILLAMYSGARVNELSQLLVEDIKFDEEYQLWYINILNEEPSKKTGIKQSVKTESSRRKVPIHSQLEKLGFIDFVKQKRTGLYAEMLFSTGLKYSNKGKWGKNVSSWFNGDSSRGNGYKVTCGFERNTRKVFHSFRHSLAKKLLDKKGQYVDISIIGALIGHEQIKNMDTNKVTFIYTENYNLSILKLAIEELEYDIDLSHVSYKKFIKKFKKR